MTTGRVRILVTVLVALTACSNEPAPAPSPTASAGQVAPASAAPKVSFYAASRFAEQASFGPTPALVAELQAKGFEKWIDEQFALPASTIDPTPIDVYDRQLTSDETLFTAKESTRLFHTAPDQLRLRVTWSLSQFIVIGRMGDTRGWPHWFNLLQRHALDPYATLMRAVSTNPAMGAWLNNAQNRPKSDICPSCAPNENFARELMQLFTIGVRELHTDGSTRRDALGNIIESYTQRDVDELARVLTGWTYSSEGPPQPGNYGNWSRAMVPSAIAFERDRGPKTVMGRSFPANQSTERDLDDAITMLVTHTNAAPFVSLRLIQHLVTSDPSPAYLGRVAAVFRDDGLGQRGNLAAVVKAILLDSEARLGDVPGRSPTGFGKFREPALWYTSVFRVLGCQRALESRSSVNGAPKLWIPSQMFTGQATVFGYYAPSDRAPVSNLLAPEQRLLDPTAMSERLSWLPYLAFSGDTQLDDFYMYMHAGCDLAPMAAAFAAGPRSFSEWMNQRFFRGAIPPALRQRVDAMATNHNLLSKGDDRQRALWVLGYALSHAAFGVIK